MGSLVGTNHSVGSPMAILRCMDNPMGRTLHPVGRTTNAVGCIPWEVRRMP